MCGTADGRCAVRDEQNAGNCESDQLCSGTADPSNAVPESDKNELCVKGKLVGKVIRELRDFCM